MDSSSSPTDDRMKPAPVSSDHSGIAAIAKSVAALAKAVSETQKSLKDIEKRLIDHENSVCSSRDLSNVREKKADFWRAYRALISIMRVLKVIVPEATTEENKSLADQKENKMGTNKSDQTKGSQLLRSLALALTDMETVASYVTQDDLSTATLSKPTDYVKIEIPPSQCGADEHVRSTMDTNAALRQRLSEKEEELQKLMQETKQQADFIQKHNRRWVQVQVLSLFVLLGGIYIGNKFEFRQNNVFLQRHENAGQVKYPSMDNMTAVDNFGNNNILHENQAIKPDGNKTHMSIDVEKSQEGHNLQHGDTDGNHVVAFGNEGNATKSIFKNATGVTDDSPKFISQSLDNIDLNHMNPDPSHDSKQKPVPRNNRSWLEQGICDELNGMIYCPEKRDIFRRRRKLDHLHSNDIQTMNKMMIRRQVFTAIGVAAAMTFPKIAPHIFKINLAQLLSLSFWKSLMEFLTIVIQ